MSDDAIARLLVSCPDRHGIVAAVSCFLAESGADILGADQHSTDPEGGSFFMRMEFHLERLDGRRAELERTFAEQAALERPASSRDTPLRGSRARRARLA